MVSVLFSGSSSPGSNPGRGHCVVFLGKTLIITLTVLLSTQVYKWVPANLMLGVTLRWTGIPSRGRSRNTPSRLMPQKPEISAGLMHHLAPMETLPVKSQFR